MKTGMTREEKNWVLYDVGNSAFVLLVATIMPIYFNYLAENAWLSAADYLAYWGYATSAATLIVALLGPVFGTLADTEGLKKPIFTTTMLIGGIGCLALGFSRQWFLFLLIYIIAKIGFSGSLIFYDSMLGDITTEDRVAGIRMGIYWKLCAVCCMSWSCSRSGKDWYQYRAGNDDFICNCCSMVDRCVDPAFKKLSTETLCRKTAQGSPEQLQASWRHPEKYKK